MFSLLQSISPVRSTARRAPGYIILEATRRRSSVMQSSMLDAPPPPNVIKKQPLLGDYSIKATVKATDETYVGFAQDLNIAERTYQACKRLGHGCAHPEISFRSGKYDEVIYVIKVDGTMVQIG